MVRMAEAAIAFNSGMWTMDIAAHAHAMLASSCGGAADNVLSAAAESAYISGVSQIIILA
eukprot:CAMPEP_0197944206 /NCGR_PEP_ID=MMETSP1439-20131203/125297_1 /TAXON_ID=66791 /ORGANISM="Gonyaulax spinifera, Strain CCMP409" /LENGTH=59 /DNA_ID=CAMNT_0043567463 /DNA_START=1736 /DNA_END=1915 /DNA_ORIENTATION=+